MKVQELWKEAPPEKDGVSAVVYDLAFKPDGSQLVCGVSTRVVVFKSRTGSLLHSLKGHKGAVYCVSYSADGKKFASGAADNTIIIWSDKGEGILKYSHNDSIQALAYNPVTQQLASATAADFGLWSPEQKSVAKKKVSSRVLSLAWRPDGQYFGLGHLDGSVSVRDKEGDEISVIQRSHPVWSLAWKQKNDKVESLLVVGCWDCTLSFYNISGEQIGEDKRLGFNPCTVSYFGQDEYLMAGGTNCQVQFLTADGTKVDEIPKQDTWVWCARAHPKGSHIAIGDQNGSIRFYTLQLAAAHALYRDRYVYRNGLTDVVVQHLITEQKVCIKCKEFIKKVAVSRDKVAVQLSSKIVIYELSGSNPHEMHYQVAKNIQMTLECKMLVVTTFHVILCQENELHSYNFAGTLRSKWMLGAPIRYTKLMGGPPKREGLLLGLGSGEVLTIFEDNSFPISLVHHPLAIRCIDINSDKNKIALVDESYCAVVYDLTTKEKTFEQKGVNSVTWNSNNADMLCFSGDETLTIRTCNFPVYKMRLQGVVVGFSCSKVYSLHNGKVHTTDLPQSDSMRMYMERKEYKKAYEIACLGVTDRDWRDLAMAALQSLELEVAKKAFFRLQDANYLHFIYHIGRKSKSSQLALPEILAYQGHYQDAAKAFAQIGRLNDAIAIFTDLRQFDEAKKWTDGFSSLDGGDQTAVQNLISRQAEWSEEVEDVKGAAEMYIKAKNYEKAVTILGKHGWMDLLLQVVREVDKNERELLLKCISHFRKHKNSAAAKETYQKMGDDHGLVQLHIENQQWEDAFLVLKRHPEFSEEVQASYAQWLVNQDRFDEARRAFLAAGQPTKSYQLLQTLADAAIVQEKFSDVAFYHYQMALESLVLVDEKNSESRTDSTSLQARCKAYTEHMEVAEIYYAYSFIHEAVTSPFQTIFPSTLLNVARFLMMRTSSCAVPPQGVRLVNVLYVLATKARELEAYNLAKSTYQRLQAMKIPAVWQDDVDLQTILIRAKPFRDNSDLLPICYRCRSTNPLMHTQGDKCTSCGAQFIRSFLTFEELPLVEFHLAPGISADEAFTIIGNRAIERPHEDGTMKTAEHSADVLRLDDTDDICESLDDPFLDQMMVPNTPILADRSLLEKLKCSEVIVWKPGNTMLMPKFFRIVDGSVSMCCGPCGHLFEDDEYEMWSIEHGTMPFSRQQVKEPSQDSVVSI